MWQGLGIQFDEISYVPVTVLVVWSLFWKGLGLWHSARRSHKWWFVIILIVNSAGIFEIIYLFVVLKLQLHNLFNYPKQDLE